MYCIIDSRVSMIAQTLDALVATAHTYHVNPFSVLVRIIEFDNYSKHDFLMLFSTCMCLL